MAKVLGGAQPKWKGRGTFTDVPGEPQGKNGEALLGCPGHPQGMRGGAFLVSRVHRKGRGGALLVSRVTRKAWKWGEGPSWCPGSTTREGQGGLTGVQGPPQGPSFQGGPPTCCTDGMLPQAGPLPHRDQS